MVVLQREDNPDGRLAGAFHGAPVGLALVAPDGAWLEANPALCRLLGYDPVELAGRTLGETVSAPRRLHFEGWWQRLLRDGEASVFEAPLLRRDGRTLHASVTGSVMRDARGRPDHVVVHVQDDTGRREHERRLEESQALYRTLADSFPGGSVLLFDRDLRYRIAGGAALQDVGLDRSALEGRTVWEALPPELAEIVAEQYRTALAGEVVRAEMPFRDRVLYTQNVPVMNDAGEIIAGMVITLDITDRKRTEEELERSNQDLEQFAYVASHDLREPLRMVTSYCQLLQRRYEGRLDADADEFIHYAVDGARRMQVLIDDLLTFSRAGRGPAAREAVGCDDLVDRVIHDLQLAIEDAGARVRVDRLPEVDADPVQLSQVFHNLIGNAVKFRGAGPPEVSVCAYREDGYWVFSVSDNGVGIAPSDQERIFEVFHRLHGRDRYPGTGIGLAIARRVVEAHGGFIWVESTPGKGSTFFFALPVGRS